VNSYGAFQEGMAIGRRGGSVLRCPYHMIGRLRDEWMRGYQVGYSAYCLWGVR
jgi:ribosome modulation factor